MFMNLLTIGWERFSENYKTYIISLGIPFIILLGTWWFGGYLGIEDFGELTRDPNTVLKGHVYTGMISNAGIFFWSASATICLFTAVFLQKNGGEKSKFLLMLFAGLLALLMGFDDVFQMHEKMFNDVFYIPEKLFFVAYFICVLVIVIACYNIFIQTDFVMWGMALGMFFISLVIDNNIIAVHKHHAFWEDSFKFTGIVLWAIYYLRTAMGFVMDQKSRRTTI